MTIPPGAVLEVAGKGLPRFEREGRGDLDVSVVVRISDHVDQERRLYEQVREAASSCP